jgi:NitT/TauT family transport system permease protein
VKSYFLPSPTDIIKETAHLFFVQSYAQDILISIYRIFLGFISSVLIGIPVGVLIGVNKYFEAVVEPFVNFVRYMPVAGFIPLSILWLGLDESQKAFVIFVGTFFQLVPMVTAATSAVPREYLDISRTLGASDWIVLRKVILPYSMPVIYDSLRISLGIAWTYLIVAEIVAAGSGIGHVIIEAQRYLKTTNIFIGIITVGLLGLLTDYLFKLFRPIVFPWSVETY